MAIKIIKEVGLDNDYWARREQSWQEFNKNFMDKKYGGKGNKNNVEDDIYSDTKTATIIIDNVEDILKEYNFKITKTLNTNGDNMMTALELAEQDTDENYRNFTEELFNGKVSGKLDIKRHLSFTETKEGKKRGQDGTYKIHMILDVLIRSVLRGQSLDSNQKGSSKFKVVMVTNIDILPFKEYQKLVIDVYKAIKDGIGSGENSQNWELEMEDGFDVFSLEDDIELISADK